MINLYKILGIKKNATKPTIKIAYRKLSKIHHPDVGGDKDKFDTLNKAYKILMDDDKRKRYDSGESVDNILSTQNVNRELSIIASILVNVIKVNDPNNTNIIEKVNALIKANLKQLDIDIGKFEKEKKKYEDFLKRLKHKKKKNNIFKEIANGQILLLNNQTTLLKQEWSCFKNSLKILKNFDYNIEDLRITFNFASTMTSTF